jgi:uncharacterized protein YegL
MNTRGQLLLFYLLADASASMSGRPIEAINHALPEIHDAIATNSLVAEKTRLGIVSFNRVARVLLPASNLANIHVLPNIKAKEATSFGNAFKTMRSQLETDVRTLKGDGYRVYRPAVFFFTDGQPTDKDWRDHYHSLVDPGFALHPNIVTFGLGDANEEVIGALSTKDMPAYMARDGADPAEAVNQVAQSLLHSVIRSGQNASMRLVIEPPEDFRRVSNEFTVDEV